MCVSHVNWISASMLLQFPLLFSFFKYSVFGFNLLIIIAVSDWGYLLSVSVQLTWCVIF